MQTNTNNSFQSLHVGQIFPNRSLLTKTIVEQQRSLGYDVGAYKSDNTRLCVKCHKFNVLHRQREDRKKELKQSGRADEIANLPPVPTNVCTFLLTASPDNRDDKMSQVKITNLNLNHTCDPNEDGGKYKKRKYTKHQLSKSDPPAVGKALSDNSKSINHAITVCKERKKKEFKYDVKIKRVVDGDTLDVDIDLGFGVWLNSERVRLMGIDTPDSRTSDKVEKLFGLASKRALQNLLPVNSMQLLIVEQYDAKGKFGRILGNFEIEEDKMATDILIEQGFCVPYSGGSKDEIELKHLANREKLLKEGVVTQMEYDEMVEAKEKKRKRKS